MRQSTTTTLQHVTLSQRPRDQSLTHSLSQTSINKCSTKILPARLSRPPHVNNLAQKVPDVVVRRETDSDRDRSLDPVHAEALVKAPNEALLPKKNPISI